MGLVILQADLDPVLTRGDADVERGLAPVLPGDGDLRAGGLAPYPNPAGHRRRQHDRGRAPAGDGHRVGGHHLLVVQHLDAVAPRREAREDGRRTVILAVDAHPEPRRLGA